MKTMYLRTDAALLAARVSPESMFAPETRTQGALLEWIPTGQQVTSVSLFERAPIERIPHDSIWWAEDLFSDNPHACRDRDILDAWRRTK